MPIEEMLARWAFQKGDNLREFGFGEGAGRNRTLGIKALEAIEVPVPPLDAQRWFNALQAQAEAARKAQAGAAAELTALLPAMLYEAFGPRAAA